jgi:hypothetical protein
MNKNRMHDYEANILCTSSSKVLLVEYFDIIAVLGKESATFEESLQIGLEIFCVKVLKVR